MRRALLPIASALALAVVPSCSNEMGGADTGPPGDAYVRPDTGPCASDTDCPGSYCNGGSHFCCEPASPPYEICGDHIDQNCDHHDESCGDNDHDGIQACQAGQDPLSGCDCDDESMAVRPPIGTTVAGAPEFCDTIDNDCDNRVDESAECCPACAMLGAERTARADACTASGECDCSSEPGTGACAAGMHCCSTGCVDVTSDFHHCGFCEAPCTAASDECIASSCGCGGMTSCEFTDICVDHACQHVMM